MAPLSKCPPTTVVTSTDMPLPAAAEPSSSLSSDGGPLSRGRGRRSLASAFPWLGDEIASSLQEEQEEQEQEGAQQPQSAPPAATRKLRTNSLQPRQCRQLLRDENFSALREELLSDDSDDDEDDSGMRRTTQEKDKAPRGDRRRSAPPQKLSEFIRRQGNLFDVREEELEPQARTPATVRGRQRANSLVQPQQSKQIIGNGAFVGLKEELLSDDSDSDEAFLSSNKQNGAKVGEASDAKASSGHRGRPKRLSELIRQQSIKVLRSVLEDEDDDENNGAAEESSEQKRAQRQQSFRRAAYLLHRVGDSLASETCSSGTSSQMTSSAADFSSTSTTEEEESFSSDVTKKVRNGMSLSKSWDARRGAVLSMLEEGCLRGVFGANAAGGKESKSPGRKRLSGKSSEAVNTDEAVATTSKRRGSTLTSAFLNRDAKMAADGAGMNDVDMAHVNAIIDRVLDQRRGDERKAAARRGRHNSVEHCPGTSSAAVSGEGGGAESNKTLDPEEFLWDSHDFAHRLGSDRSLPFRGAAAAAISDSVRALNLEDGGRSIVPEQLLSRKMSSGRMYLKILEDWNERRDQELLGEKAGPPSAGECIAGARGKKDSDRTIGSATDCLWSNGSMKHTVSIRLHGSKGSSCGGEGSARFWGRDHVSQSIRALDLEMDGTAERLLASSMRRKLACQGGEAAVKNKQLTMPKEMSKNSSLFRETCC